MLSSTFGDAKGFKFGKASWKGLRPLSYEVHHQRYWRQPTWYTEVCTSQRPSLWFQPKITRYLDKFPSPYTDENHQTSHSSDLNGTRIWYWTSMNDNRTITAVGWCSWVDENRESTISIAKMTYWRVEDSFETIISIISAWKPEWFEWVWKKGKDRHYTMFTYTGTHYRSLHTHTHTPWHNVLHLGLVRCRVDFYTSSIIRLEFRSSSVFVAVW